MSKGLCVYDPIDDIFLYDGIEYEVTLGCEPCVEVCKILIDFKDGVLDLNKAYHRIINAVNYHNKQMEK